MVKLNSQPDHHRDQQEVNVKDRFPMVGGDHRKKEDLFLVDEMRGRVKSDTQTFSPFADLFKVRSDLIQTEEGLQRPKGTGPGA